MPLPCICKPVDPVGSENKIQIKRTVSELNEVLPLANLLLLWLRQRKPKLQQGSHHSATIFRFLFYVQVNVLGRIGVSQENRTGFTKKQVAYSVTLKDAANVFCILIFEGWHTNLGYSPTSRGDSGDTILDIVPWCQRSGIGRRPGQACRCV